MSVETAKYFVQQPDDILVWDIGLYDIQQNALIYIGKEFPDITLEYPAGSGVVFANLVSETSKSV